MWWSAWSRNQTEMPVRGRGGGAPRRARGLRGVMASAWAPPFGAPGALGAVERAAVHRREVLAYELVQRRVEQLRRPAASLAGGGIAPAGHVGGPPAGASCSRAWTSPSDVAAWSSV